MMRLAASTRSLLLLAPDNGHVPQSFDRAQFDADRYDELLAKVQRLRGRAYLDDGAIERSQLTYDGRHALPVDKKSWHVLVLDPRGEVCGCARYREHENTVPFSQLSAAQATLAQPEEWRQKLRWAIESDLLLARKRQIAYAEFGGWALREDLRGSAEAIRIALGGYGLARILGGCIGVTMATVRHSSSSMLTRIGGRPPEVGTTELPSYYDANYGCEMNVLRFDSEAPNPRYEAWVAHIKAELLMAPVIYGRGPQLANWYAGAQCVPATHIQNPTSDVRS